MRYWRRKARLGERYFAIFRRIRIIHDHLPGELSPVLGSLPDETAVVLTPETASAVSSTPLAVFSSIIDVFRSSSFFIFCSDFCWLAGLTTEEALEAFAGCRLSGSAGTTGFLGAGFEAAAAALLALRDLEEPLAGAMARKDYSARKYEYLLHKRLQNRSEERRVVGWGDAVREAGWKFPVSNKKQTTRSLRC